MLANYEDVTDPVVHSASSTGIYDLFEPTFIQSALQTSEKRHLGHLIFGKTTWLQMSGETDTSLWLDDPLSQAFVKMSRVSC